MDHDWTGFRSISRASTQCWVWRNRPYLGIYNVFCAGLSGKSSTNEICLTISWSNFNESSCFLHVHCLIFSYNNYSNNSFSFFHLFFKHPAALLQDLQPMLDINYNRIRSILFCHLFPNHFSKVLFSHQFNSVWLVHELWRFWDFPSWYV